MKIYISPSNQPSNAYVVGNTTEKKQMEELAKIFQGKLSVYNVDTLMASFNLYIHKSERPTEAHNAGCSFYMAFHSNAGSKGTGRGCVVMYHPNSPLSKKLAENIVKELNAISPHGENRAQQVINGMTALQGKPAGEIRSPMEFGIPSVLIEVDFHDNPLTARYIINEKNKIADAVVRATVETFGLMLKTPAPTKDLTGMVKVLYDGADGLNARTTPEFDVANVAQVVRKGELFTVVGKAGDFYKLKSGLYLTSNPKYVEFYGDKDFKDYTVKITADVLNIREKPTVTSKDVGNVRKGDVYTIVDEENGWGKLKSGAGWIRLDFTKTL